MNSIIEKLFNGELKLAGRIPTINREEYREACSQASKVEEALRAGFTVEQEELFEAYCMYNHKEYDIELSENFTYGFCLGMTMATEARRMCEE